MSDINIKFSDDETGNIDNTSGQHLSDILNKLTNAVDNLAKASKSASTDSTAKPKPTTEAAKDKAVALPTFTKLNTELDKMAISAKKLNTAFDKLVKSSDKPRDTEPLFNSERSSNPFKEVTEGFNRGAQDAGYSLKRDFDEIGKNISSTIGTAIAASVGVSALRYFNNQANAIMGQASAAGHFTSEAIQGNANTAFGGFTSQLFDVERQRQEANTNALYEGVGGAVGGVGGAVLGGVAEFLSEGKIGSVGKWGAAGASLGVGVGDYEAANLKNQYTEQLLLAGAGLSKRKAEASVSEWQTGFGRWGMKMTDSVIVPKVIAGDHAITAPLQKEFETRYGGSQNYNAILNHIVPYLNNSPLDSKNGDLNQVSQQFMRAGFSVQEFGTLTRQSAQYTALTGKQLQDFSTDIYQSRQKFGNSYGVEQVQQSLNLQMMGFDKDQSEHLANQAIYNPSILSGAQQLTNQSYSDYYRGKAMANIIGFDPNLAKATGGASISESVKALYRKDIAAVARGESPSQRLLLLDQSGQNARSNMISYLQKQVKELHGEGDKDFVGAPTPTGLITKNNAAQENAESAGTLQNLLAKVESMTITATNVTLINQNGLGKEMHPKLNEAGQHFNNSGYYPPSPVATGKSPAKH